MTARLPLIRLLSAVCFLTVLASGCGLKLPALTGGDPQTLEAATAAAQEIADRGSSRDFAGVWLMMSKQVRNKISQADFVALQNACGKGGVPFHVTGVRMEGEDTALVRWNTDMPVLSAFKFNETMLYEDGKWVQAPDPDYAQDYRLPLEQIIAKRRAAGHCDKSSSATATAVTPSPSSMSPPAPPSTTATVPPPQAIGTTSDKSGASTGGTGRLVAVRLAGNHSYDRLVLEFADGVPAYEVGYRPLPAHADGSGHEIPLPGASALVQVTLTGATGSGWGGGSRTYFGPATVTGDTAVVTEAKAAGDFEALLTWVVGLRSEVPFRVAVLDGPPRLVIDFQD